LFFLASTSAYRRALLGRLRLPFECVAPEVDEQRVAGETAEQMTTRLARLKAEAVARRHPGCVVIGSDQAAVRGAAVLGKPGSIERCHDQPAHSSGQQVAFLTAVHVIDGAKARSESHLDRTLARVRRHEGRVGPIVSRPQPL
jgi:septum formation protein